MTAIQLKKDLEDWAREEVAAGRAESVESLVDRAMRDQQMVQRHKDLVLEGYKSLQQGEISEDEFDAEVDRWLQEDLAPRK